MKHFPLLFCLVLIFVSGVFAQTTQNSNCPTIDVRGSGVPRPNETSYFTADVDKKGKELNIEYIWTVSGGKIVEGQGSKTITVKVLGNETLSATVGIKGFPEGCANTDTETPVVAGLSSNCPSLDVTGGIPEPNVPLTFTANLTGDYDLRKITFKWTVSSGEILEGQGTSTIKVLRKNNDENIAATVEVTEPLSGCVLTGSETSPIIDFPPVRLFDEYGPLTNGDFKARIQNLFVELGNNPGAQGYMIIYGTKRQIAQRKKMFLDGMAFLKLDASRLTMVDGGANPRGKGIWTNVWIVPPGAKNPTPDMF